MTAPARILKALSCLALLAAFLSGIRCATAALSTKNTRVPVKVYELGQRIPRNSKILDIMDKSDSYQDTSILGDPVGSHGLLSCRYRPIIWALKKSARALGGDAVAILHVKKDDLCFEIKAFLLDMIDIGDWPRVGLTDEEIKRVSDAGGRMLDEIEGIWDCHARSEVMINEADLEMARVYEYSPGRLSWRVPASVIQTMSQLSPEEQSSYRVAVVKASGDTDYPYAAYILDPEIPEWKPGFLKARIRKLSDSSGYEAKWYGTTFQDDLREFHPDETGALKAKVVVELGLKYSIDQTLTRIYPPATASHAPD